MRLPRLVCTIVAGAVLGGCQPEGLAGNADGGPLGTRRLQLERMSVTFRAVSGIPPEHCRVHTNRFHLNAAPHDDNYWRAGTQLLIFRGATLRGMCTVDDTAHSIAMGDEIIQVSQTTLDNRVWQDSDGNYTSLTTPYSTEILNVTVRDGHTAVYAPAVGRPTFQPPLMVWWRPSARTFLEHTPIDDIPREYLNLPDTYPSVARVAYTAPHPWENGKAWEQFKAVEDQQDTQNDVYWAAGMRGNCNDPITGPNPFLPDNVIYNTARFHIKSEEISLESFPLLRQVRDTQPKYAVAFHGTGRNSGTCDEGTKVGGGLGTDRSDYYVFRRGIAEIIRMMVDPHKPRVSVQLDRTQVKYGDGSCGNDYDGTAAENFVNQLARYSNASGTTVLRGVQIETGADLDQAVYNDIGLAVREVFDCLNAPRDNGRNRILLPGTSATYVSYDTGYTRGRCHGLVVDASLTAGKHYWQGGLALCTPGAKAHVDIYKYNSTAFSWDRIGGGDVSYTSANGECRISTSAYDDGTPNIGHPDFQPANGAGDQGGLYRMIVYAYTGDHFTLANARGAYAAVWTMP
jgi:hypothetical protein